MYLGSKNKIIDVIHLGDLCHVAVNIARGIKRRGYSVLVLISSNAEMYEAEDIIKINPWHQFKLLKYIYTMLFTFLNRRSIFHCHGMAGIFPFILNLKYILHVHGSDIREIKFRGYFLSNLYLQLLKKATAVVVATPDLVDDYVNLGLDESRLHFIPNSVDMPKNILDKRSTNYKKIKLFCPSSNHPIKCKDKLLMAFIKLYKKHGSSVELTLIDHPGTTELLSKFNLSQKIKNNIFVLPVMKHQDLLDCYEYYDIVLDQFGGHKAHGVVAFEACSKGIAVISTIGEKVFPDSGIYPGNTVDLIYSSVSELIDNRLIKKAGLKSYDWASQNLSNSIASEKFFLLYKLYFRNFNHEISAG